MFCTSISSIIAALMLILLQFQVRRPSLQRKENRRKPVRKIVQEAFPIRGTIKQSILKISALSLGGLVR